MNLKVLKLKRYKSISLIVALKIFILFVCVLLKPLETFFILMYILVYFLISYFFATLILDSQE